MSGIPTTEGACNLIKMLRLEKIIRTEHFNYLRIWRQSGYAIYSVSSNKDFTVSTFDVVKIKIEGDREIYPKNNRDIFSFKTIYECKDRILELIEAEGNKPRLQQNY